MSKSMNKMRFLVISDGHGDLEVLDKLDSEFKSCDVVLFGGDFAKFKEPESGLPFLQKLVKKHDAIHSVLGNCDEPEFLETIEQYDISVQKSLVFGLSFTFIGCGGGTNFTGTTPNERTEDEILSDLKILSDDVDYVLSKLILITHNPPKDTKTDTINGGIHVGSEKIRTWIEVHKPFLVITGHIHESTGIDYIGETPIINPGALCEGKYATIEVEWDECVLDASPKINSIELKSL